MHTGVVLSLLFLATQVVGHQDAQLPFSLSQDDGPINLVAPLKNKKRELKGRFLHITDLHPDPFYKHGATFESACHLRPGEKPHHGSFKGREKRRLDQSDDDRAYDNTTAADSLSRSTRKPDGLARKYGNLISDCDSPQALIDLTFDWLKKEWADEVDFVVWTGDSARHDTDRNIPRSPKEIFDLNRKMAQKMLDAFGEDVPIVPTMGNNDIWPHNIILPGPNKVTEELLRMWKHWIPEEHHHVFERGAYFSTEVIPDQLAIISLNTMYWFSSNSAVDGCQDRSSDPGALQMDWLEVQLDRYRDRGMQVFLIGHVPPHEGLYFDNCFLRYGDLALRYQDTIVSHMYGHQNIDHFFFMDVSSLEANSFTGTSLNGTGRLEQFDPDFGVKTYSGPELAHGHHLTNYGRFSAMSKKGDRLKESLMNSFDGLPAHPKLKQKDYAVVNVAPSIIPAYLPAARIFSYNISGVTLDPESRRSSPVIHFPQDEDDDDEVDEDEETMALQLEDDDDLKKKKKKKGGKKKKDDCKKPENEDKPHCRFKHKPRYSSPHSPARTNTALSILGYTQFFIPEIEKEEEPPEFVIEYSTFQPEKLAPPSVSGEQPSQPPPVPYHMLPGYDRALESHGNGANSSEALTKFLEELQRITPFPMKDLTIKRWIDLARELSSNKKSWNKFTELMFVSSGGA